MSPELVETLSSVVVIIAAGLGAFLAAVWLGLVIWAFRDIRARSRDFLAQVLATLLVAFLGPAGLLVYVMVRPHETLSEAYERSLEEEALLQSIEEQSVCPACGQRADKNWLFCPICQTRLKATCAHCDQAVELYWIICPYCGSERPDAATAAVPAAQPAHSPQVVNVLEGEPSAESFKAD